MIAGEEWVGKYVIVGHRLAMYLFTELWCGVLKRPIDDDNYRTNIVGALRDVRFLGLTNSRRPPSNDECLMEHIKVCTDRQLCEQFIGPSSLEFIVEMSDVLKRAYINEIAAHTVKESMQDTGFFDIIGGPKT